MFSTKYVLHIKRNLFGVKVETFKIKYTSEMLFAHTQPHYSGREEGGSVFLEAFRGVNEAAEGNKLFLLCEVFGPDGPQPLARGERRKKFMFRV